jgi:hypothetical protein
VVAQPFRSLKHLKAIVVSTERRFRRKSRRLHFSLSLHTDRDDQNLDRREIVIGNGFFGPRSKESRMVTKRIKELRWPLHATEAIASLAGPADRPWLSAILGAMIENFRTIPAEGNRRNNYSVAGLFSQPVTANAFVEHRFSGKAW